MRYLYKYLDFGDNSLKVFTASTVMYSNPLGFNDPFDCKPYFRTPTFESVKKHQPSALAEASGGDSMPPGARLVKRKEAVRRLEQKVRTGAFAEELIAGFGVLCLCRHPLDPLMWGHYADKHRGFVVEFCVPAFDEEMQKDHAIERLAAREVVYRDSRPQIDVTPDLDRNRIEGVFFTKGRLWSYEAEERIVNPRGHGEYPYNRNAVLSGVIAGARMGKENLARLRDAVSSVAQNCKHAPSVVQARIGERDYTMSADGYPRVLEA
jgi:hypothetical protein